MTGRPEAGGYEGEASEIKGGVLLPKEGPGARKRAVCPKGSSGVRAGNRDRKTLARYLPEWEADSRERRKASPAPDGRRGKVWVPGATVAAVGVPGWREAEQVTGGAFLQGGRTGERVTCDFSGS